MKKFVTICALIAVVGIVPLLAKESKQDASNFVNQAIQFYKANGKAKLLEAISKENGQFHKGNFYVFLYDLNGVVLAHPANHGLIGKSVYNLKDPDGVEFVKAMVDGAKEKGEVWVTYKWTDPVTKKIGKKLSFAKKVDDIVFVCGIYE